eukprot:3615289-Amphidinium_carterae.2
MTGMSSPTEADSNHWHRLKTQTTQATSPGRAQTVYMSFLANASDASTSQQQLIAPSTSSANGLQNEPRIEEMGYTVDLQWLGTRSSSTSSSRLGASLSCNEEFIWAGKPY